MPALPGHQPKEHGLPGRLDGKVAIVTGGGTGIGEAIALKFAKEGASLIVAGLPGDPVDDVVQTIRAKGGGAAAAFKGDLSHEYQARACVDAAIGTYKRLDVLVNNAGIFPEVNECQDYSTGNFDALIRHNIRNAFLMTRFALPHLQKTRGVVLCTGSEAGEVGEPMVAPYGGTKAFLHAFVRGLAYEQGKYGVRANCVCPGPIDTAWTQAGIGPMNAAMEKQMLAGTVLGRRGTPEEVANVFAFVASRRGELHDRRARVRGRRRDDREGGPRPDGAVVGQDAAAADLDLHHSHDGYKAQPEGVTVRPAA